LTVAVAVKRDDDDACFALLYFDSFAMEGGTTLASVFFLRSSGQVKADGLLLLLLNDDDDAGFA
jgi:hypothetical protein